jgi:hypothetical protein
MVLRFGLLTGDRWAGSGAAASHGLRRPACRGRHVAWTSCSSRPAGDGSQACGGSAFLWRKSRSAWQRTFWSFAWEERAKTEHARGLGKCFVQQSAAPCTHPSNPAPGSTLQCGHVVPFPLVKARRRRHQLGPSGDVLNQKRSALAASPRHGMRLRVRIFCARKFPGRPNTEMSLTWPPR